MKKGKIKKFNELFDTEELRSDLEIDYMRGDLGRNIISGRSGTNWWKKGKKSMEFVLSELIDRGVYQLLLFVMKPELPGIRIITSKTEHSKLPIQCPEKNQNDIFYTFILERKDLYILMAIKIVSDNNFELVIISERESDKDAYILYFTELDMNKLIRHLKFDWVEYIWGFGKEVINWGKDIVKSTKN